MKKLNAFTSLVCAVSLTVAITACDDSESDDTTASEATAGAATAGAATAGEMTAGEVAAGEVTAGEVTAGDMNAEEIKAEITQKAYEWLMGHFDSSAQASAQPSYFSIQLLSCEVEATEIGDRVLYIEQAPVSNANEPYRQRLYYVESIIDENGEIEVISNVYSVNNSNALIGLCDRDDRPSFTLNDVSLREGCAVHLNWIEDHFEGGTRGEGCSSTLGGASYATSEVYMNADTIRSWDRGFDRNDDQVWGATDGAYEFIRQ